VSAAQLVHERETVVELLKNAHCEATGMTREQVSALLRQ
jgi:hypothetical protein